MGLEYIQSSQQSKFYTYNGAVISTASLFSESVKVDLCVVTENERHWLDGKADMLIDENMQECITDENQD
jgi:hypothetical protein